MGHHLRWLHATGLVEGDSAAEEHAFLCSALTNALTFDQLNVTNCVVIEQLARRLQHLEERHRSRLGDHAEADLFGGGDAGG